MNFLILHGWQNHRPEGHWQRWLAEHLTGLGHRVDYPQLPEPDAPVLEDWLAELRRLLADDAGERTVICHSLACLLWLHALGRDGVRAERVLLVAPPSASVIGGIPEIAAFAPPAGVRLGKDTRIVAGDDDPYCPEGVARVYAEPLGADLDLIPGGGHLAMPDGYGPWPDLLAWCLDPTVRIGGRPATP